MIIELNKSSLTGAVTELGKRKKKEVVELILGLERSQEEDLIRSEGNRASRTLGWIYGHWTWGRTCKRKNVINC